MVPPLSISLVSPLSSLLPLLLLAHQGHEDLLQGGPAQGEGESLRLQQGQRIDQAGAAAALGAAVADVGNKVGDVAS